MHRRNAAERASRTFKAHFLATLTGVADDFPKNLWDLLLPQAEMTLNTLRQSALNPKISAWEFYNGPFDYNATPMGPLGCRVLIHKNPDVRKSWDYRGAEGWSIGTSLDHYRCQRVVDRATKAVQVADTVEFRHHYLTQPDVTPANRIVHGVQTVTKALTGDPATACDAHIEAIEALRAAFNKWQSPAPGARPVTPTKLPPRPVKQRAAPKRPHKQPKILLPLHAQPPPRVQTTKLRRPQVSQSPQSVPRVEPSPITEPVARRMRSHQNRPAAPTPEPIVHRTRTRSNQQQMALHVSPLHATRRRYPAKFIRDWACPVLDKFMGDTPEHRQLRRQGDRGRREIAAGLRRAEVWDEACMASDGGGAPRRRSGVGA